MELRRPSRPWCAFALAALLLFALGPSAARAQGAVHREEFLQLRVRQAGGETVLVLPRKLVEDMCATPTGATFSVGTRDGRDVRVSADRMLRALRDVPPATSGEVHLLTRATDSGAVFFFAKALTKAVPPRSPSPLFLEFDLTRKGAEGGRTSVTLPMMGAATAAGLLSKAIGFPLDGGLQPLLENLLECARKLGSGPVATVVAPDAEAVFTAR